MSITLRQLIETAGGVSGNGRLKAVVPGGGSAAILTADEIDVTMDVDGLEDGRLHDRLGRRVVMDESVSIPEALWSWRASTPTSPAASARPAANPPAGSTRWSTASSTGTASKDDLDTILDVAKRGAGTTICAFYDGAVGPYISYIEKFRSEFEALMPAHA